MCNLLTPNSGNHHLPRKKEKGKSHAQLKLEMSRRRTKSRPELLLEWPSRGCELTLWTDFAFKLQTCTLVEGANVSEKNTTHKPCVLADPDLCFPWWFSRCHWYWFRNLIPEQLLFDRLPVHLAELSCWIGPATDQPKKNIQQSSDLCIKTSHPITSHPHMVSLLATYFYLLDLLIRNLLYCLIPSVIISCHHSELLYVCGLLGLLIIISILLMLLSSTLRRPKSWESSTRGIEMNTEIINIVVKFIPALRIVQVSPRN